MWAWLLVGVVVGVFITAFTMALLMGGYDGD